VAKPSPADLRALARRDPALGRAMKRLPAFPGFPVGEWRRLPHWHFLARAVVYQQLAGKAAATIHGRVCALTPGPLFPTPEELLALSDEVLRGAGLSRNKTASLRDLAAHLSDGRLDLGRVGRASDERVVEALVPVRGIGLWSAQMFLLFRLGRLDVLPTTDLGVQEGLRLLDGGSERPTPKEIEARAAPWRPLASVASWFMWRLVDEARGEAGGPGASPRARGPGSKKAGAARARRPRS
jgi:DNA-3-methyladenine glycosylase II